MICRLGVRPRCYEHRFDSSKRSNESGSLKVTVFFVWCNLELSSFDLRIELDEMCFCAGVFLVIYSVNGWLFLSWFVAVPCSFVVAFIGALGGDWTEARGESDLVAVLDLAEF